MILTDLPFVGRLKELEVLRKSLTQTIEQNGSCVFVSGLPGVGKSRLLEQYCTELTDSEHTVIQLTIGERPISEMQILVAMIREYLRTAKILKIIPKVIDDITYSACHKLVPELDAFFPYQPVPPKIKLTAAEMIFRFLHNLTIFNPVVLIVEDMHNATVEIRRLFEYLLGNFRTLPILCILTSRPSPEVEHWSDNVRSLVPCEILEIKGLSSHEIVSLNSVFFQKQLPQAFFDWLTKKTEGNPIFVRGILRFLLEKGIVYLDTHKNTWRVYESFEDISTPEDFSQTVAAQMELLTSRAKRFLGFASLTDTGISPRLVGLKLTKKETMELLKTGMVIEKDKTLFFSHPLYRDAVYEMLNNRERKELHNQLGERLVKNGDEEHGLIQYTKAGRQSQQIVNRLVRICEKHRQAGNNSRALHCMELVFDIITKQKRRLSLRMLKWMKSYAIFLLNTGRHQDALRTFDVLLKKIRVGKVVMPRTEMAVAHVNHLGAFYHAGKYEEVISRVPEVLRLTKTLKGSTKNFLQLTVEMHNVYALYHLGSIEEALDLAQALGRQYHASQNSYAQYRIFGLLGAAHNILGEYEKAVEYREQALAFAMETGMANSIATAQGNLGLSLVQIGEYERAAELYSMHQEHQVGRGWQREISISHLNFGNLYYCQGRFRDAIDEIMKGIAICEQIGSHKDLAWFYCNYGASLIFLGNHKFATHYLDEGCAWAEKYGLRAAMDEIIFFKGILSALTANKDDLAEVVKSTKKLKSQSHSGVSYRIFRGLHLLLNNEREEGLALVKKGLTHSKSKKHSPGNCRLLYMCAKVLQKYGLRQTVLDPLIADADEIALKLGMKGWSDWFHEVPSQRAAEPLRIYALGAVRVELPQQGMLRQKDWEGLKTRQLFSVLVRSFFDNRSLNRDEIGLLLWPELTKKQVVNNFHVCLTQLKGIIGKTHVDRQKSDYKLVDVWVDALHFKDLVQKAEKLLSAGKVHAAERKFSEALELYTGDFFKDFYDAWLDETRAILSSLYRKALFLCGDIYIRKMKIYEAEELGRKILALDPYDEEGHRFLMHCYVKSGEKAKALAQYKRCQEIFKKGLNCEPSLETRKLYEEIMQR